MQIFCASASSLTLKLVTHWFPFLETAVLRGHQSPVLSLLRPPPEARGPPHLASCGPDRLVKLWDLSRPGASSGAAAAATLKLPEGVHTLLQVRADATASPVPMLAIGGSSVFALDPRAAFSERLGGTGGTGSAPLYDGSTGRFPIRMSASAFGNQVAVGGRAGPHVQIYDLRKLSGPPSLVPCFPDYLGCAISAVHLDRHKLIACLGPPGIPPTLRRPGAQSAADDPTGFPSQSDDASRRDRSPDSPDSASRRNRGLLDDPSDASDDRDERAARESENEDSNSSVRVIDPKTWRVVGGVLDDAGSGGRLRYGIPPGGLGCDGSTGCAAFVSIDSALLIAESERGRMRGTEDRDEEGTHAGSGLGKFW